LAEGQVDPPLHGDDDEAFEPARLGDLDEGHQVHAFVFSFLHEGANPAVVILHATQALQVIERGPDHARDGGDGFQHDRPVAVTLCEEGIGAEAQQLGEAEGEAVRKANGLMVDGQVDGGFGKHTQVLSLVEHVLSEG
jgi:hypothetical protein